MGSGLSSWLALARSFQLVGGLAAAVMHGFLTIKVHTEKFGLTHHMSFLAILICAVFGYTTLALSIQHTGGRSKKPLVLICFLIGDVLVCAVLLLIITLLARSGLPEHCERLTKDDNPWKDSKNETLVHSDNNQLWRRWPSSSSPSPGELRKFCGLERSYFAIAVVLIFVFIFTIVFTALRIYEQRYLKHTNHNEPDNRTDNLNLKLLDSPSPQLPSTPINPPHQPPSEGILTRTTSIRSTFTAATASTSSQTVPHPHRLTASIPRRLSSQQPIPHLPRRPVPSNPSIPGTGLNSRNGFEPVPLHDEDEDSQASAALVTDGMQMQSHNRQPTAVPNYRSQHHQRSFSHTAPFSQMPMLPEEDYGPSNSMDSRQQYLPPEADAEAQAQQALISDGGMGAGTIDPNLPPYQPSDRRMSGHGAPGESNEMMLSGYIKGQTRAQNMKDSGNF